MEVREGGDRKVKGKEEVERHRVDDRLGVNRQAEGCWKEKKEVGEVSQEEREIWEVAEVEVVGNSGRGQRMYGVPEGVVPVEREGRIRVSNWQFMEPEREGRFSTKIFTVSELDSSCLM